MAELSLTVVLPAPVEVVWDRVQRTETMRHVSRGALSFQAVDPPALPDRWKAGRYKVALRLFGVIPAGTQVIAIELPEATAHARAIRDNGGGALFPAWDHWTMLEAAGAGATRYTDRVRFASVLPTPIALALVRLFYRHRQRRWRALLRRDAVAVTG